MDNRLTNASLSKAVGALGASWQEALRPAPVQQALEHLSTFLSERLAQHAVIYPAAPFRALQALQPQDVKVVILGQDPYHGPGQAQGLAFSVPDGFKRPPSLRNILAEVESDYPADHSILTLASNMQRNDLSRWTEQGVLLLNTVLTVEDGQPASHARLGWETITDCLIRHVASDNTPKVFMLWGAHAQAKQTLIENQGRHLILSANHPSP
ncbi:MAG: uracil-DNA glycosylase, partial [Betaproteobacteria bacterium]